LPSSSSSSVASISIAVSGPLGGDRVGEHAALGRPFLHWGDRHRDLVILKKETALSSVRTYLGSVNDGYSTYGELGDVVIYRPNGTMAPPRSSIGPFARSSTTTPVAVSMCLPWPRPRKHVGRRRWGEGLVQHPYCSCPSRHRIQPDRRRYQPWHHHLQLRDIHPGGGFDHPRDNNHGNIDQTSLIKNGKYVKPIKGLAERHSEGGAAMVRHHQALRQRPVVIRPDTSEQQTNLLISLG